MLHNGIEKLSDPAGFEQFVVQAHLKFLPAIDVVPNAWTLLAGGTEIGASFDHSIPFPAQHVRASCT